MEDNSYLDLNKERDAQLDREVQTLKVRISALQQIISTQDEELAVLRENSSPGEVMHDILLNR